MAHRVVWSRRAFQDLEAIATYIAVDSPVYAAVVLKTIVSQTKALARFPRSGRKVPEFDSEDIRELLRFHSPPWLTPLRQAQGRLWAVF